MALLACGAALSSNPSRADLQLHWKLDESSGTTAADSSPNLIDGAWQGTVGAAGWMPGDGVDGGSVAFTGANVDSFIAEGFAAVAGTPFTISAWVKTASTQNDGLVYLGNGGTGNSYCVLRKQGGVARANIRNTAEIQGAGLTSITDGEWHHVLAVYAGTAERRIYTDGVLEGTNTTDVPEVTLTRFGIGALTRNTPYNPADLLEGQLDDIALWDRAFTDLDAAALNGLGVLGAGNAADLDPLVEAFAAQDTVIISGRNWDYATGLAGAFGETGGSVAGIDAFIVLDDLGNGMRMSAAPGKPIISGYTATPTTIFLGESATLGWDIVDADTVEIDQGIGAVDSSSGSVMVTPAATTTYTLTATNGAGSVMPQVTVTVIPGPVIASFTATPPAVFAGETVTLAWDVQNFTSIEIDQGVGVVAGAMGSVEVTPAANTTYALTATNANGSVTAMASVTVFPTPPPRELLLHWPLDEGSGTTTADLAGANGGTFLETGGSPTWTPGLMGNALLFPNADDVSVRAFATLVDDYPFTVAAWVNTTASENDTAVNLGTGASFDYYSLRVSSGNSLMTRRNGAFFDLGGPAVNDGEWHLLVGVFSHPGSRTLYVDGVLAGQDEADSGAFGAPDRFAIGALDRTDTSIVDPFNGSVDDASLWRGILDANEVAALAGGATGLGLNASDIDALLTGFEARSTARAAGLDWSYAGGLAGAVGATGGTLAGGDGFIVLDDSGNGMVSAPIDFSIISVVRGETGRTITWKSAPGASYRIDFSTDLQDWGDEVDDNVASQGETTAYLDPSPTRLAAERGYYRVALLPADP